MTTFRVAFKGILSPPSFDVVHINGTLIVVTDILGKHYVFRHQDLVGIVSTGKVEINFEIGAKLLDYMTQQGGMIGGEPGTPKDVAAQVEWYAENFTCNHQAYQDFVRKNLRELVPMILTVEATPLKSAMTLCEDILFRDLDDTRVMFCGEYDSIELFDGLELES